MNFYSSLGEKFRFKKSDKIVDNVTLKEMNHIIYKYKQNNLKLYEKNQKLEKYKLKKVHLL